MFQLTATQTGRFNNGFNALNKARVNGQGLNIARIHAQPVNNMPFAAAQEEPRHKSIIIPSFSEAIPGASKEL